MANPAGPDEPLQPGMRQGLFEGTQAESISTGGITQNIQVGREGQRQVLVVDIDAIPPRRNLDDWIDRSQPQSTLRDWIEQERFPLVEIVAAGGFGKSLQAAWAFEQIGSKFDKALWVNCKQAPSFNSFSRWILQEIGFQIVDETIPDQPLIKQLVLRLIEKRCLVVMDQLETVGSTQGWPSFQAFFEQWQQDGRNSTIVVTTREASLVNERCCLNLTGFTAEETAVYLKQQGVSTAKEDNFAQLSHLAQGHPLLLKLAASWLQKASEGTLQEADLSFFAGLFQQDIGNSEANVEQMFKLLLKNLSPSLRHVLLQISVYRWAFSIEQAQVMESKVTNADIESLQQQGLLLQQNEQWLLHPLIQRLVKTELCAVKAEVYAHQRAIEYFSEKLQAKTPHIEDALECFHHNCEIRDYSTAYDTINRAYDWLDRQGYYHLISHLYARIINGWKARAPKDTRTNQRLINSLSRLGNACFSLGEYDQAIDFHRQSLCIAEKNNDRQGQGNSLGNLGNVHFSLGSYLKAIDFYRKSLDVAELIHDYKGKANSSVALGNAHLCIGKYKEAIGFHERSLKFAKDIDDVAGEATALASLGNAYDAIGEYRLAIRFRRHSLRLFEKIGYVQGKAGLSGSLGNSYASLGYYDLAINFHRQHYDIAKSIGDRRGEATALGNLGVAHASLGYYRQAISFYRQHCDIAKAIGDRQGEAAALGNLGAAHASLKDYDRGIGFHQKSLDIAKAIGWLTDKTNQRHRSRCVF